MNNLKFGVLACGLLGLIGCFLPMVSLGSESISFFKLREMPGGGGEVYPIMAGYLAALVMGALAAAKPPMQRWQAGVATAGFAIIVIKMRGDFFKLVTDGAIGAKLMGLAALVGIIVSIMSIAKPETAK